MMMQTNDERVVTQAELKRIRACCVDGEIAMRVVAKIAARFGLEPSPRYESKS